MGKANSFKPGYCILCGNRTIDKNYYFCYDCYENKINIYGGTNKNKTQLQQDYYNLIKDETPKNKQEKIKKIAGLYFISEYLNNEYGDSRFCERFLVDCYNTLNNQSSTYSPNDWYQPNDPFAERSKQENNFNINTPGTKRTKDGHFVRSRGEALIDNFLFDNNIRHIYEQELILDGRLIKPDFYLPDYDVYIEYWGYDENSQDKEMAEKYEINKQNKLELYKRNNIKLIEILNDDINDINNELYKKLKSYKEN